MIFENIFSQLKTENRKQLTEKPKLIADKREKNSLVISELISLGIDVEMKFLPVADFLINNIAIERKTISDFLSSMLNKRLLKQLEELKQYENKLLILEGIDEQEIYCDDNKEGINPNAIRGFLLSIVLKHKIPIIYTKDYKDTARFLLVLTKKKENQEESLRAKKKSFNRKEQLQYILEGFPGIGPKSAKKLLKKFSGIKEVINAEEEQLKEILGKKTDSFLSLLE